MLKLPENKTWAISDTHFNHKNILEYTKRPYATLEQMNRALIELWVANVQPDDYVIHCGDFFMGRSDDAPAIFNRLTGRIVLTPGNHDKLLFKTKLNERMCVVDKLLEVQVGGDCVVACHFPLDVWNNAHKGWFHIHGHSHGSSKPVGGRLDVGVDAFCAPSGAPRRWSDVSRYFHKPENAYVPADHHGTREFDRS